MLEASSRKVNVKSNVKTLLAKVIWKARNLQKTLIPTCLVISVIIQDLVMAKVQFVA